MTKEQISEKVKKAQNAFSEWKKDIQKRADHRLRNIPLVGNVNTHLNGMTHFYRSR